MTVLLRAFRMLVFVVACAPALSQTRSQTAIGYVGWWLPNGWRTVTELPLERLHFFDIAITESGELGDRHGWPDQWGDLLAHAANKEIPIDVTLTLMDARIFHRVFSSSTAVSTLLEQTLALASLPSVAGIHLDVEMYGVLDASDVAAYRGFVRSLIKRLGDLRPAKSTSVFLPFQSQSYLYDTTSLQGISHVVIQGYDAHWLESKNAGPIAPLDGPYALTWKKAVAYADGIGIPRALQFMGYPLYGYEWKVLGAASPNATTQGKGVVTTFAPQKTGVQTGEPLNVSVIQRVISHGATFDPVSASSYYTYRTDQGQRWIGWFEDWWGLGKKAAYVSQTQLGGLAFFLLGYDDGVLVQRYHQLTATPE